MMKVHMTRTCLNQEPHKNPKIFMKLPNCGEMIGLKMYEYILPL
jgi:hypothetical protein